MYLTLSSAKWLPFFPGEDESIGAISKILRSCRCNLRDTCSGFWEVQVHNCYQQVTNTDQLQCRNIFPLITGFRWHETSVEHDYWFLMGIADLVNFDWFRDQRCWLNSFLELGTWLEFDICGFNRGRGILEQYVTTQNSYSGKNTEI